MHEKCIFQVSWDLYLHHFLQMYIVMVTMSAWQNTMNIVMAKMGYWWLMQIATEQPIFCACLVRKLRLKLVEEANYPKMFYYASAWHYISKTATTILIWYYYTVMLTTDGGNNCSPWYVYNVSYVTFLQREGIDFEWGSFTVISLGIVSPILFLLQMWQGYAFYLLGKPRGSDRTELMTDIEMERMEYEQNYDAEESGMDQEYANPFFGYHSSLSETKLRRRHSRSGKSDLLSNDSAEHKEDDVDREQHIERRRSLRLSQKQSEKEKRKSKDD